MYTPITFCVLFVALSAMHSFETVESRHTNKVRRLETYKQDFEKLLRGYNRLYRTAKACNIVPGADSYTICLDLKQALKDLLALYRDPLVQTSTTAPTAATVTGTGGGSTIKGSTDGLLNRKESANEYASLFGNSGFGRR